MYDPTTGTFLEEDPLGFAAGLDNLSEYVGNSPTTATDPTGKITVNNVVRRHVLPWSQTGQSINPANQAKASFGGEFAFRWLQGDGQVFDQHVTDNGTFTLTLDNGVRHSLSWRENYDEAWVFGTIPAL